MDSNINLLSFRSMNEANTNVVANRSPPKQPCYQRNTSQMECGVCMSIMYNATSITPCLHTYCAGCVSKWFGENKNCPNCRAPGSDLYPNRLMRTYVEDYLKIDKDKRRCRQELSTLDEFEMEYWTNWLVQFDPAFLSAMQLSLSGDLRPAKIEESVDYHKNRYAEVKKRVETLRFEQHLRKGGNDALESIDDLLKRLKKQFTSGQTKRAIIHSMNCVKATLPHLPNGVQVPNPLAPNPLSRIFEARQALPEDEMLFARNAAQNPLLFRNVPNSPPHFNVPQAPAPRVLVNTPRRPLVATVRRTALRPAAGLPTAASPPRIATARVSPVFAARTRAAPARGVATRRAGRVARRSPVPPVAAEQQVLRRSSRIAARNQN